MLWWRQSRNGSCHSGGGEFVIPDFRLATARLKTFRIAIEKLAMEIKA